MAVTRQEVVFEFDANTGEFLKATKKLEESMEGVADAAQDAADSGVRRAAGHSVQGVTLRGPTT